MEKEVNDKVPKYSPEKNKECRLDETPSKTMSVIKKRKFEVEDSPNIGSDFIIIQGLPKTEYCIHITHPHLNEEMILSMFERTICTVLVFHAVNVK